MSLDDISWPNIGKVFFFFKTDGSSVRSYRLLLKELFTALIDSYMG